MISWVCISDIHLKFLAIHQIDIQLSILFIDVVTLLIRVKEKHVSSEGTWGHPFILESHIISYKFINHWSAKPVKGKLHKTDCATFAKAHGNQPTFWDFNKNFTNILDATNTGSWLTACRYFSSCSRRSSSCV